MTAQQQSREKRVVTGIALWHVLAFGYLIAHLVIERQLPLPYFWVPDDTFMDYFHTTFWSHGDGRYTDWQSIYPPFAFVIGSLISDAHCYVIDAHTARDACVDIGFYIFVLLSLLAAYLNARLFFDEPTMRLMCFLAIVLSLPFLFAIERGNYVLLAYLFLVLAAKAKSRVAEGIFLACAVNVKQYLVVVLAYTVLKSRYAVLVSAVGFSALFVWGGSLYLSEPHPLQFLENMFLFLDPANIGGIVRLPFAISADGFVSFVKAPDADMYMDALQNVYGLASSEFLTWYAEVVDWTVKGIVAFVAMATVIRARELHPAYISYIALVCLFNLSDAASLYALILLLPYLPFIYRKLTRVELVMLFLLFQPFDIALLNIWSLTGPVDSYLTGDPVTAELNLTVGAIVRPVATFVLLALTLFRLLSMEKPSPKSPTDRVRGVAPRAV